MSEPITHATHIYLHMNQQQQSGASIRNEMNGANMHEQIEIGAICVWDDLRVMSRMAQFQRFFLLRVYVYLFEKSQLQTVHGPPPNGG